VRYQEPVDVENLQIRQAYIPRICVGQRDQLQEALLERPGLPRTWASVTEDSDWTIRLTPQQVRELMERLTVLIQEAAEAAPRDRDHASKGSEQYTIQLHGFPRPGRLRFGGGS